VTIAWVLYVLLVGTLLACAALALDGIVRRTSLPTRWVWVGALTSIVGFALVAPRSAPVRDIIIPTVSLSARAATATPAVTFSAVFRRALDVVSASGTQLIAAADTRLPESVALWSVVAWSAMSGATLGALVFVYRRVAKERHAWPVAELFGTPVRITSTVGPAVIGLSTPEIVVPRWLFGRSRDEQRLVIVHEREHVAARDQLLPVGGLIVAALLPWHPAVWWALSRLRLAIELDCDARVLNRGITARSYGALLIDIAGQCAGHRAGALALSDGPAHLERRLLAMMQTRTRFALLRTGALATLAGVSILVACEARLPTTAEGAHALSADRIATVHINTSAPTIRKDTGNVRATVSVTTAAGPGPRESMKVSFRQDAAGAGPLVQRGRLRIPPPPGSATSFDGLVLIDGVRASERALAKLSPNDIESIEVVKGASAPRLVNDPAAANGVITIVTKHGAH
jgi:hypothetical protein